MKKRRFLVIEGVPPIVVVAPTLETLLKLQDAGKLKSEHLARFLAMAQSKHRRGDTVSLPTEVVVMIGKHLVTHWKWTRVANEARVQAAHEKATLLRAEAEEMRQRNPSLSDSAITQRLAPDKRQQRNIRRIIAKPK